jgi:hypothetical protein
MHELISLAEEAGADDLYDEGYAEIAAAYYPDAEPPF